MVSFAGGAKTGASFLLIRATTIPGVTAAPKGKSVCYDFRRSALAGVL